MRITIDLDILDDEQAWSLQIDNGDRETLSTDDVLRSIRQHVVATMDLAARETAEEPDQDFDPENIYDLPSMRQSIEEDRRR